MKVLFVCEGNKMRSPMAEAFYNHMTNSSDAVSAGADPYPLGGSFAETPQVLKERGIEYTHGSQLVTQEMVDAADLVVAFPTPMMPDFVMDSTKTELWEIDDPFYKKGDRVALLRQARDEIEVRVMALVQRSEECA